MRHESVKLAVSLGRRSSSVSSENAPGTVPTYFGLFAAKHARLVESARAAVRDLDESLQSIPGFELAGRVLQRLYQLRSRTSERTEEQDVGEVHVLESLGMLSDAGDEAVQIRRLCRRKTISDGHGTSTAASCCSTYPLSSLLV